MDKAYRLCQKCTGMSEFSLKVFHVELPNARSKKISIVTHHHPVGVPFQSCHFGASRDFTASKKQASTASQSCQTMGPHADKTKTATVTYSFAFHPWDLWQCCLFCLLPPVCQIFGRKEPIAMVTRVFGCTKLQFPRTQWSMSDPALVAPKI